MQGQIQDFLVGGGGGGVANTNRPPNYMLLNYFKLSVLKHGNLGRTN